MDMRSDLRYANAIPASAFEIGDGVKLANFENVVAMKQVHG